MTRILWLLLGVTLLLSFSGFYLRFANENNNKTVVTAVDYRQFLKSANSSNRDLDEVWEELKDNGVTTVALAETTLREMASKGDVYISPFAEFQSFTRVYSPEVWQSAQKAIGNTSISPVNLIIVSSKPQTTAFLDERLASRFFPDEIIRFDVNEQSYFIINAELTQLKKTKTASMDLDTRLGFEEPVLKELKSQGFNIILRPGNNSGFKEEFQV